MDIVKERWGEGLKYWGNGNDAKRIFGHRNNGWGWISWLGIRTRYEDKEGRMAGGQEPMGHVFGYGNFGEGDSLG